MQRLGKYEIVSELGRGGMGVVYKARDPLIKRLVALKTITSSFTGNTNLLERFYQEARSAGALQHPNIVTIYELGDENGTPFIAMEYLQGETLEALIARRVAIPLAVKLGYFVQVSEGLQYAHEHGVIHRDIKPGNIMVTAEGAAKIVDFGIARIMDMSMTQANLVVGSRAYMAPQLYKGERADARSDIWALGATLYELLAFQKPFAADTEAALMFKVIHEDPQPLRTLCPDCPEALEKIINHMLEKSASTRFQSMGDVVRELGALWRQAQQEIVQKLLADSQGLIEVRDFRGAQELLRKALQIDITNMPAKSLLDQISREVRRLEILARVQDHVNRARGHLQARRLVEARKEVEAALELDSQHESAQLLWNEIEEATNSAERLEQQLRFAKQRLVEGSLTEAREILQGASTLGAEEPRLLELRKQIAEEEARRERRRQLSEVHDRARELWMELKFAECLTVLEDGLKQFPGESVLLKLEETARQDWEEEEKQRQLGHARKLLGQQQFAQARAILEKLAKQHPGDRAVSKLHVLIDQGESELRNQERLIQELAGVRKLVKAEKYPEAIARGDALLREYKQDFELKELVEYARAELAQRQLREKERELEAQIQALLQEKRYAEATTVAQRALRDFAGHQGFQKLWEEAEKKRKDQDVRAEYQKRIRDLQLQINRQELTEAIDLAQQTLTTLGPDVQVSRLLEAAKLEQEEMGRWSEQKRLDAVQALVEGGKLEEATRMLSDAFATQILQPSHPRAKLLLTQIEKTSLTLNQRPKQKTTGIPAINVHSRGHSLSTFPVDSSPFSASNVLSQTPPPAPPVSGSIVVHLSEDSYPSTSAAGVSAQKTDAASRSARPRVRGVRRVVPGTIWNPSIFLVEVKNHLVAAALFLRTHFVEATHALKPYLMTASLIQKRRLIMGGVGVVVLLGSVSVGIPLWRTHRKSRLLGLTEKNLREEAERLWDQHEPDQSEEKWKQIQSLHGALENKASQQITFIEVQRGEEQDRFEEGNRLLQLDKNNPQARQDLQEVVDLHLWHAADAQKALNNNIEQSPQKANALAEQEQALFQEAERLFVGGNYDSSRRRFRDLLNLQVPNSTLRPKAEEYLNKIRALNDDKKNYDAALLDLQNERWDAAREEFRQIIDHKGASKDKAQKQLGKIAIAQNEIGAISELVHSQSYLVAKNRIDSMQEWPKSSERLRQALVSAEQQDFDSIKFRSQGLLQKQDIGALEHLQDELNNFLNRVEDAATLREAADLDQNLNKRIPQLKKELSSDIAAFNKAEKDYQQARSAGDINRLNTDIRREFEQIARGTGYNRAAAQSYATTIIPDTIGELSKNLAAAGKAVVPPISCSKDSGPTRGSIGQAVPCAKLDMDSPLQWIGNPTIDVPPGAKQAGKLPYTLRLIVVVDGNGRVIHLDKDGPADQDFLKKAKDAAKKWQSTKPLQNGKPVNTVFPVEIEFQP
jgi:eukaryotic-like serine/threonine-protein kinase